MPLNYSPSDFISSPYDHYPTHQADDTVKLNVNIGTVHVQDTTIVSGAVNDVDTMSDVTATPSSTTVHVAPTASTAVRTIAPSNNVNGRSDGYSWSTLLRWRGVKRRPYTDPAKAACKGQTFLDMNQFSTAVSYRTVRDMLMANPIMPVCLLGCGLVDCEGGKKRKKLPGSYFWGTPSYLEGVHFKDLAQMISAMHPNERNHCTMVLADKPVHLFFDFDASADSKYPEKAALYHKVQGREAGVQLEWRRLFNAYFMQVFNRQPNLSGLHWESASTTGKFSLHAHVITEAFVNVDHHKSFVAGFVDFITAQPEESLLYVRQRDVPQKRQLVLLLDASVYTKNRNFRLIECCKPGKQKLQWIADPGAMISNSGPTHSHCQGALPLNDLVFRGLISYAIDVASDQYLSYVCASADDRRSSGSRRTAGPAARSCNNPRAPTQANMNGNCSDNTTSKTAVSSMWQAMIQVILRSDSMLGALAEVDSCYFAAYRNEHRRSRTVCIVGHCKAGSAICMTKSDHTATPPQLYRHQHAVTSFTITEQQVKLRDWSCGQDASVTVQLMPEQSRLVETIMMSMDEPCASSPRALAARTHSASESELESLDSTRSDHDSESESDIDSESDCATDGESEPGSQPKSQPASRHGQREEGVKFNDRKRKATASLEDDNVSESEHSNVNNEEGSARQVEQPADLHVAAVPSARTLSDSSTSLQSQCNYFKLEFDPWGLHTVDCHSIRDTRPQLATIEEMIHKWEEARETRRQIKRAKRKYGGRDQKSELNSHMQQLQRQLQTDIVLYLNQYFKLSTRMAEPLVVVTLIEETEAGKIREWQADYFAVKAFLISYSYLNVTIQGHPVKVAQMWLDHPQCSRFDKIVFQPAPDGKVIPKSSAFNSHHNLWTGFKVSAFDSGRYMRSLAAGSSSASHLLRPLLHHIWSIWCRRNQKLYEYTMNWMAWCIQRPDQKIKTALVIRGDKGSGKGIVMEVLSKIFGHKHYYHAQRAEQLLGDFNDHLQACLLCFVDEVTFANDTVATNVLKGMVTESKVTIHTKFKSRMLIDSHMNLVLAGNMAKLVDCEGNERRYFVLETDNRWSGQQTPATAAYFSRVRAVPPELLRLYLSRRDISLFNPYSMPQSPAMRDQKALSLPPLHQWWHDCLVRGYVARSFTCSRSTSDQSESLTAAAPTDRLSLVSDEGLSEVDLMEQSWQLPLRKDAIQQSYSQWCKDTQSGAARKTEETGSSFWKKVHALLKSSDQAQSLLEFKRPTCKQSNGRNPDSTQLREHVACLPSLKVSRELFCRHVVHDENWCFDQQGESTTDTSTQGPSLATDAELGLDVLHC